MSVVNVGLDNYIEDDAGNAVPFRLLSADHKVIRDLKSYKRPSDQDTGEKETLVIDAFKVSRLWVLTVHADNFHDFDIMQELITKTMPQNTPIQMYLFGDGAGGYVYNGAHVAIKGINFDMDWRFGGERAFKFQIMVKQGSAFPI